MPNFDGTGPNGQGAMTGRALGPCAGGVARGCRRGLGRGLGRGGGFGLRANVALPRPAITLTEAEEKQILESEIKEIERERAEIEKRLKEMKQ